MSCADCIYYNRCAFVVSGGEEEFTKDNLCSWFEDKAYYVKLPAYIGMKIWIPCVFNRPNGIYSELGEGHVSGLQQKANGSWKIRCTRNGRVADYTIEEFNEYCFTNKADAEKYLEKEISRLENS